MSASDNFQTLAVNQRPFGGTDYPWVYPQADVQYLLGDLWLAYESGSIEYQLPLAVAWMYNFGTAVNSNPGPRSIPATFFGPSYSGSGFYLADTFTPTHAQDMVIVDALGEIVFDSTQAGEFTSTAWGLHLVTLCWTGSQGVLRTTRHTARPAWAPAVTQYKYIAPAVGLLDGRTYERLPRRVRSITIGEQTFTSGNLILSEGYNLSLVPTAAVASNGGSRLVSQIAISADPGDGLGVPGGCDNTTTAITAINNIAPTADGDFYMDAPGCYRIQRPVTVTSTSPRITMPDYQSDTPEAASAAALIALGWSTDNAETAAALAAIQITNDCGPCCTCDDFVATYKGLAKLDTAYRALGTAAEAARNQHQKNINRWNAQLACRQAANTRLLLNAEPGCVLFAAGSYCNMTPGCAVPIVLRLTFQTYNNGTPDDQTGCAELKCRENYRNGADTSYNDQAYTPSGGYPVMDAWFDRADPDGISKIRTRIQLCCNTNNLDTIKVTLSVHIGALTNPVTGDAITLASSTVPADVLAIWTGDPPPYPAVAFTQQTVPVSTTAGCGSCS